MSEINNYTTDVTRSSERGTCRHCGQAITYVPADDDDLTDFHDEVVKLAKRVAKLESTVAQNHQQSAIINMELVDRTRALTDRLDAQDNLNILNVEAHKKLTHDLAEAIRTAQSVQDIEMPSQPGLPRQDHPLQPIERIKQWI